MAENVKELDELSSEKFNKGEKYSDSLKFARRCITFAEFEKMRNQPSEPELGNNGNNVEPKTK